LKDGAKALGDMDSDGSFTVNDLKLLLLALVGMEI
jgi:hypothetical protein